MNVYYKPNTMWKTLYTEINFDVILWVSFYHAHVTDEQTRLTGLLINRFRLYRKLVAKPEFNLSESKLFPTLPQGVSKTDFPWPSNILIKMLCQVN